MRRPGFVFAGIEGGQHVRRESEGRSDSHDECVVRFWQGYVSGEFQAYLPGSELPFRCSPQFRTWRPPWRPRLAGHESPAAADAFAALADELARDGWRPASTPGPLVRCLFVRDLAEEPDAVHGADPASLPEELFLRALDSVAGEQGATAAQVGRALYGEEAAEVERLPQRVGSRLRALQLQGKVDRRERGGVRRWFPLDDH